MPKLNALLERPVLRRAVGIKRRATQDDTDFLATALTFYGFLSIFPLLLLALSILGFIVAHDPAAQTRWILRLSQALPGLESVIGRNVSAIVRHRAATGVVGLVGLLWSGIGIAEAARHSLDRIFRIENESGFFSRKVSAMASTVILGLLFLTATALAALIGGLRMSGAAGHVIRLVGGTVSFAFDFLLFLISYRVLTSGKGPPWKRLIPGAIVGALGFTTLKIVGSWYAARTIASSGAVYGTFASTIGALILLLIAARLFLYGSVINAYLIEESGESTDRLTRKAKDDTDQLRLDRPVTLRLP